MDKQLYNNPDINFLPCSLVNLAKEKVYLCIKQIGLNDIIALAIYHNILELLRL